MIASYIGLQIMIVVGIALNAWMLSRNIALGNKGFAVVSFVSWVTCVVCFIVNWRRMSRWRREEREWKARGDAAIADAMWFGGIANQERVFAGIRPRRQLELDYCYEKCICPDCGQNTLHLTPPITCMSPACGSRFTRDITGQWSRL